MNQQLQQINIILDAAKQLKNNSKNSINLINMGKEKPRGSGYINSIILGQILLLVYGGTELKIAIKTVIDKEKSHLQYITRGAYYRDYRLFCEKVFQNIQNGGRE